MFSSLITNRYTIHPVRARACVCVFPEEGKPVLFCSRGVSYLQSSLHPLDRIMRLALAGLCYFFRR